MSPKLCAVFLVAKSDSPKPTALPSVLHTDTPCFMVPHRCYAFYKWKARLSTSKKVTSRLIAKPAFLLWSGTEPVIFQGLPVQVLSP